MPGPGFRPSAGWISIAAGCCCSPTTPTSRNGSPIRDHKIPKTYQVKASTLLSDEQIDKLRMGVELNDGPTRPAKVTRLRDGPKHTHLELIITEGRNRQVRRMLEAVDSKVSKLVRTAIGPIRIGDLPIGKWRYLTDDEVRELGGRSKSPAPKLFGVRIPAEPHRGRSVGPLHEVLTLRGGLEAECATAYVHLQMAGDADIEGRIPIQNLVAVRPAETRAVQFEPEMARRIVGQAESEHGREDVQRPARREVDRLSGGRIDLEKSIRVEIVLGRVEERFCSRVLHLEQSLEPDLAAADGVRPSEEFIRELPVLQVVAVRDVGARGIHVAEQYQIIGRRSGCRPRECPCS